MKTLLSSLAAASLLFAAPVHAQSDPTLWPTVASPYGTDDAIEERIDGLLAQMSIEQKVGQMIQAEIKSISPDDIREYHIGSVLNGGGSIPSEDRNYPLALWIAAANAYYDASMDTSGDRLAIPVLWGTDAVHGHNNVRGATIFPHNIGLGAANDPALMRDIGTATAREVATTGIDWTFAPTVAVAQDARWGRTYESFSSDTAIVTSLSSEMILGLQGHPALGNALDTQHVIATAKHFIGDGGTTDGDDQGNTELSEEDLRDIHGRPYFNALGVGVQTVMASFNSWNGEKLHGSAYLLTTVLKDQLGFDGLVVGDWNGHEQIPGCTQSSCPEAINAGVDLIMVPEQWRAFQRNTVRQVRSGEISMERIDDAVRRILRVKLRAGLFDDGRPSQHDLAARFDVLGHPSHRAVARDAVRKSLVLLENESALPLSPSSRVFVGGSGADNLPMQAGGWTITWQGRDTTNADFPGATSIEQGFAEALAADGALITDANATVDAAVIVFGETPYAEFEGDLPSLDFNLAGTRDFRLMQSFAERDTPVIAVFLTGRPRMIDPVFDLADAVVVAWLPGSEGGGIADVLVSTDNAPFNATGRLPFAWPGAEGTTRFPLGYGLSYSASDD